MALFSKDTTKKTATAKASKPTRVKRTPKKGTLGATFTKSPGRILHAPRITEKATYAIERRVYVFDVAVDATKRDIMSAIEAVYGVTPVKVNTVRIQPRRKVSRSRRRAGIVSGYKKAHVYLKEGDKIDLV